MGRIEVLAAILLVSAVFGVSDASSGLRLRGLLADVKKDEKPGSEKDSPPPTLLSQAKGNTLEQSQQPLPPPSDPKKAADPSLDSGKPKATNPASPPPPPPLVPKKSDDSKTIPKTPPNPPSPPPPADKPATSGGQENKGNGDHGKKEENKKGSGGDAESGSVIRKTEEFCRSLAETERCLRTDFVACLEYPTNESKGLSIIIQNTGENALSVNITAPTSISIDTKRLELHKNQNKKIPFSTNAVESLKIILKTTGGECPLQTRPTISDWNPLQQFPAYANYVTPIYGVYFLFFTIVVAGGTWACCKFGRKGRRTDAGVPYRQLEMGVQPHSTSLDVGVSTADGWERGWDDEWDEEEAIVRSSEKHSHGNVSSNGVSHTSKSTNKDGWDDDWDE